MLQELFIDIVNMSLTAVPIILVVLLARMVLKFVPKTVSYALWAVVFFRLLCPFSFEMSFSLVPAQLTSGGVIESYADSYIGEVEVYEQGSTEYDVTLEQGAKQAKTFGEVFVPILSSVWITGIVAIVSYSLWCLAQLKRRLMGSVHYKGNVYLADHIESPFVLGFVKPKIYLPSTMRESEYTYTILHEIYHIKRKDHVVKLIAFTALCIHWFNPLVWLAFGLVMTDMEMSCDEAVLRQIGESAKAEYSISLLGFATGKRYAPAAFLAFGEVNPKARIKNVLKWKKPVAIFSVFAATLAVFVGVLCLANPKNNSSENDFDPMAKYDLSKEEDVYDMLEARYLFRPVEFSYLPEGVVYKSVEVNAKDRYTKIHYEGADTAWIDLYVAELYMTKDPQFLLKVDDSMYQVYSGDEKESYEVEASGRGPVQVSVYKSRISDASVIESYFAGHNGAEYVIQSYNVSQEEYKLMIENLRFDK